jgi:phage shock protein PspC (stress-responsive transcriptional regulator)
MTTSAPTPPSPAPRRLYRSNADRMIGGVCGGIARYFGIDATLVRIAMVALVFVGGAGVIAYVAALLLVPVDESEPAAPSRPRDRVVAVGIVAALVLACIVFGSVGLSAGAWLFPAAVLALAGLAVYWLASGERPAGGAGDLARRAALGLALLAACGVLAAGSFLASGLGGGVVVAGLVVAAGAGLVIAAFAGGARWLVLPALAVAVPLAFVAAADIDLDGGFGEKSVRPGSTAEIRPGYSLGAGELRVDLRDVDLPAGDRRLRLDLGAGHALVLVGEDVCVASEARIGMGGVEVLGRDGGGIDVDWTDARRAPARVPRLVVDADIGLGLLEVRHDDAGRDDGPGRFRGDGGTNAACDAA